MDMSRVRPVLFDNKYIQSVHPILFDIIEIYNDKGNF